MFDARPLSMTKAGKIQNYLGKEPDPWIGKNGVSDARHLAHQAAGAVPRPLQRAQRRVHGAELRRPSAEHELPVRRQSVRRRLVRPAPQLRRDRPQAGIARRHRSRPTRCSSTSTTIPASSRCDPDRSRRCRPTLRNVEPPRLGRRPRRLHAAAGWRRNAGEPGRFSAGSSLMLAGLDGAPQVHRQLASLTAPARGSEPGAAVAGPDRRVLPPVDLALGHLRAARAASTCMPPIRPRRSPSCSPTPSARIATLFKGLNDTPFDAKRSLFDVTTVMVASELGRTMRGAGPADRPDRHQPQPVLQLDPDRRQGHPRRHGDRRLRPAPTRRPLSPRRIWRSMPCSRRPWACPSTSPR